MLGSVRRIRKISEKFGRKEGEILAKKGCEEVWVAYRELIGCLYESWTIGIGRVYK